MSLIDAVLQYVARSHQDRARGWNTWDTRSALRHVLLPEALAMDLGFAAPDRMLWLDEACFGRVELARTPGLQLTSMHRDLPLTNALEVSAGKRSYDGGYTCLEVDLRGARFRVETCAEGDDAWLALVTPLQDEPWPRVLTLHGEMLWNAAGVVRRLDPRTLRADLPQRQLDFAMRGQIVEDHAYPTRSPFLAADLSKPVLVGTTPLCSVDEARQRLDAARAKLGEEDAEDGELATIRDATRACLAWNVIYEPTHRRVICPVARDWNTRRGGYALFCWDSFFTAWLMTRDRPHMAWPCALETFRHMVDDAFVPNVAQGTGRVSRDRSQPPVAGLCLLGMDRLRADRKALQAVWPALLAWNRWWDAHRANHRGTISPGSHPFEPVVGDPAEFMQPNTAEGAALEAGMDNAPMYDDIPFDPETHQARVEDVGITALYATDCEALAELARRMDRPEEAEELDARAERYAGALDGLWCEERGLYLNRRLDTGGWIEAASPTCFYPLLTGRVPLDRARRMIDEHLMNPERFFGDWMIPLSPRDEPAFAEQIYLRGRVWPPFNFLVYLGLARYPFEEARREVVDRSCKLIERSWPEHGVVAENYSAIDGTGGREAHTHPLYSWGPLLGFMRLIEEEHLPAPLPPVSG